MSPSSLSKPSTLKAPLDQTSRYKLLLFFSLFFCLHLRISAEIRGALCLRHTCCIYKARGHCYALCVCWVENVIVWWKMDASIWAGRLTRSWAARLGLASHTRSLFSCVNLVTLTTITCLFVLWLLHRIVFSFIYIPLSRYENKIWLYEADEPVLYLLPNRAFESRPVFSDSVCHPNLPLDGALYQDKASPKKRTQQMQLRQNSHSAGLFRIVLRGPYLYQALCPLRILGSCESVRSVVHTRIWLNHLQHFKNNGDYDSWNLFIYWPASEFWVLHIVLSLGESVVNQRTVLHFRLRS